MATRPADIVKAIDAEIESRISGSVSSYSIAGRSFTKTSLSELMDIRARYADIAALESHGGITYADLSRESVESPEGV